MLKDFGKIYKFLQSLQKIFRKFSQKSDPVPTMMEIHFPRAKKKQSFGSGFGQIFDPDPVLPELSGISFQFEHLDPEP